RKAMVDVLVPRAPFRIELDVTVGLADVLSHTAGNLPWTPGLRLEKAPQRQAEEAELRKTLEALKDGPQPLLEELLRTAP
ncbi:MAG TPA: hypothetical protein VFR03_14085, partial [Thermoanaerobaculia bacterium]|nr:hypothetical protein [Thermoanaerobaculia bacterium]